MRRIILVFLVLLFSGLGLPLLAQTFNSVPLIPTAFDPVAVASSDLDHDGNPDLVYVDGAGSTPHTLHILLGHGDGTFSLKQEIVLPAGICGSCTINIADVSKDGKLDLIMGGNNQLTGLIAVLLGNGDGTFQQPVLTSFSPSISTFPTLGGKMAVGDVNEDGAVDLAVPDPINDVTYILLGDNSGKFTLGATVNNEVASRDVRLADLNHDGHLDLVSLGATFGGGFLVALGKGDGTFQLPVLTNLGAGFIGFLVDVDGDGQPDIIGTVNPTGTQTQIFFLKGHNDGTFASTSIIGQLPSNVSLVNVGDFNGDGILDLEVSNPNGVGVLLGQNGLSFAPMISSLSAGFNSFFPAVPAQADFNKDGHLDLAMAADGGIALLTGNGDGSFANGAQAYDVGKTITTIAIGDFNGDKHPDIAVSVPEPIPLLLLGQPNGTFVLAPDPNSNSSSPPNSLGVGDFNGDGHADLFLGPAGPANNTSNPAVLFGDGHGNFSAPVTVVNGSPNIADFNRDGRSDMVSIPVSIPTCFPDCPILVSLGQSNQTFNTATTPAVSISGPIVTAWGDLNGDGIPDVVLTGEDGTLQVWLGKGDGTFSQGISLDISSFTGGPVIGPGGAAIVDLDGDGKNDLVLAPVLNLANPSFHAPQALMVLYGKGNGTFESPVLLPVSHYYSNLTIADVNQDHKPDLALNDGFGIAVILNLGNRLFDDESHYSAGPSIAGLSAVDVNGDGFPDLVVGISGGTKVVVLLNNPTGISADGKHVSASLSLSPEPSNFGVPFTATAQVVAPNSGTPAPTGTVDFILDGGLAATVPLAAGTAQFTFSTSPSVGLHTVVASYSGDLVYSAAAVSQQHTVNPPVFATTTVVTPNPSTLQTSQTLHLTATVSAGGNSPCNGCSWGLVTFLDGTQTLGAVQTDGNGVAVFDTVLLAAGTHTVSAVYHGFKNSSEVFSPSTSAPVTVIVTSTPTSITAGVSPGTTTAGTVVTLSASVSSGKGVPFGGITFFDGTHPLGTASVTANGSATFHTASLGAGTHTISATFNANATFAASSSSPVPLIVNAASSSSVATFVALSPTLRPGDGTLLLQATVTSANVSPQSTVTFMDSGLVLGTAATDQHGIALLTVPLPPGGSHILTASFSGDSQFAPAVSPELPEQWSGLSPAFSTSVSPSLITFNGVTAQADITITTNTTLQEPVQLACASGLPAGYSCNFNPSTLSQSGSSQLSIQSVVTSRRSGSNFVRGLPFVVAFFFGLLVLSRRHSFALLVLLCGLLLGCGGSSVQNQAQIQVITIQASSGTGNTQTMQPTQIIFVVPGQRVK